jgi:uncharacterized protein YndB with AHSA1/START domain
MNKQLSTSATTTINAPISKVWDALTNSEQIKKYFYGTETKTDWKVGSSIEFTGEWEGTSYIDKGQILSFNPEQKLEYTYLSSFTGLADEPENYSVVGFELESKGNSTQVTVSQSNFKDETHRDHSKANWGHVLDELKKLLES